MIDKAIKDVLNSSDITEINIPIFQRPYSWGNIQLSQFLSDLDACISLDDQRHFYGLIVYVTNKEDIKKIDLIDGQQRITTLIILFSTIRDLLEDFNLNYDWEEDEKEKINQSIFEINSVLSSNGNPKLNTENESNFENIFIDTIQRKITSYTDPSVSPRKEYDEQKLPNKNRFLVKKNFLYSLGDGRKTRAKNSYKNYIAIYDYLDKKISKQNVVSDKVIFLTNLYTTVLANFRVIPFHVENYERAFEYFEVLNDRGLDVSALDLIKNKCLKTKGITALQRDTIFKSWSNVFSGTLDHTYNLLQFIRYGYMSKNGHITNKNLYSSYEKLLDSKDYKTTLEFLNKELHVQASMYKYFNSNSSDLTDNKIHNVIQLLKSTKTTQWFSVGMSVLNPIFSKENISNSCKKEIITFLESLHELMFSINFIDKVANEIEKKLPSIAKEIKFTNEKDFLVNIRDAYVQLEILKQDEGLHYNLIDFNLDWVQDFEKNNSLGNMLIFFLKYKRIGSSTIKLTLSSLEHTFPQSPNKTDWPIIEGIPQDDYKKYIYNIGNFLLTHTSENSSYGNKSFALKKIDYTDDNIMDVIDETSNYNLKKLDIWDFDVIKNRQEIIYNQYLYFISKSGESKEQVTDV
jgi:uncharacterized protein with ParB-like and HNH nuclease domain